MPSLLARGYLCKGHFKGENGTRSSSPLPADNRIYRRSEAGTTKVEKAGRGFEILGANKLDSLTDAGPVAVGTKFFIRTAGHFYYIQQKQHRARKDV